jgi:GxxExxY protein
MTENEISYKIRGIVYDIYNEIGPGLLESVYEEIMFDEIKAQGMKVKRQVPIPLIWKDKKLKKGFRADLIVENKVLIELKSVEIIPKVFYKVFATYLKLTGLKLGLMINFYEENINNGITRYANKL